MTTVYKDMNADIKAFKVYKISAGGLELAPEITDIYSYNHQYMQLHHYVKAQSYKNRPEWYKQNGIEEKLILMPTIMHEHLESPIYGLSDKAFYKKYKIKKDLLLFNKRKWLENEGEKLCSSTLEKKTEKSEGYTLMKLKEVLRLTAICLTILLS